MDGWMDGWNGGGRERRKQMGGVVDRKMAVIGRGGGESLRWTVQELPKLLGLAGTKYSAHRKQTRVRKPYQAGLSRTANAS